MYKRVQHAMDSLLENAEKNELAVKEFQIREQDWVMIDAEMRGHPFLNGGPKTYRNVPINFGDIYDVALAIALLSNDTKVIA